MASAIPGVSLNLGLEMPALASGLAPLFNNTEEQMEAIILDAIRAGYRHFDTAAVYGTEKPLGKAIAEAVRQGLVCGREEVFVTTKLWSGDVDPELLIPALHTSLRIMGLDYVDSYLIHLPVKVKQGPDPKPDHLRDPTKELLPLDMKSTWAAMEECQRLGLAKSIGVSNFSSKKLSDLLLHATIVPAVNQVEMSALWDQRKLRKYCGEKGIHLVAWSALGGGTAWWGSTRILDCPLLKEIAYAKGKTTAQVALRYVYQLGASIAVKSYNSERMREDMKIFDWHLSHKEMERIQMLPQSRGYLGYELISPTGPYKTIEELWDGEV